MRVWCCTDRPTDQLRANGMVGVSVTVGGTVLKPGDSMDVPSHLVAEIRSALRNGLLSRVPPAAKVESTPLLTRPIIGFTKILPIKAVVVPTETSVESEPLLETPEPDNTEHRRRRR